MVPKPEETYEGSNDSILLLTESVEQRIREDESERDGAVVDKNSTPLAFWEGSLGTEDAQEAEKLFRTMLEDEEQLRRILVARKFDIEKSTDLFFEQVRFRAKWRPLEIVPESIPTALPSGAWRLCGYSREGCVVSNYKLRKWNPDDYGVNDDSKQNVDDAVDEYTRYTLYMIELMIAKMREAPVPQQFVVLFDLDGFSVSLPFRKHVRLMIRKLIYVAQAQYPERLRKVLLVNAPYGFATAWNMIKPLLDEKTASKVTFASTSQVVDEVHPEVLTKEYGGTRAEYPVPSRTLQKECK